MRLRLIGSFLLTLTLVTGCSMTHGDPRNPKQNPHPTERYEITATTDGPGPWDSVSAYVGYDVVTPQCTPEAKFLGVHALPRDVGRDVEMTRVGEKTWKGYFHRDFMLDEDYYGLGACHWDATSVTANFTVHGIRFNSGSRLDGFLRKGPQSNFFRKSFYETHLPTLNSIPGFSSINPQVVQQPDAFFSITVAVNEIAP